MATTAKPTAPTSALPGFLADAFRPERRGSTHRIEFTAGLTTFVTMAYIIFVNTGIMEGPPGRPTGLNPTALIIGTIFAAIVPTLFMGLWADLPWALAPGLGYNALFVSVVLDHGIPVGAALALVFLDGLAFLLLVSGPWRESIIKGIPLPIKLAAGAGIGLFIAFIGMVNAGIVKFVAFQDVKAGQAVPFNVFGLPQLSTLNDPVVILTLIGLLITGVMMARRIRGALLLGIIATAALAWIVAFVKPDARAALLPNIQNPTGIFGASGLISFPDLGTFFSQGFGRMDFGALFGGAHGVIAGAVILFFLTFLVTDIMDSTGTFSGLATKLGILDKQGNFPRSGRALVVDAAAGMWGPVTGNATIATFIESASGVGEGGKTGLTAIWVAGFFLLALFFVPFINLVPLFATAPALLVVGYLMIEPVLKIGFQDVTDGLPAFLTLLTMPVTFSIADGMFVGIVSYVALKALRGNIRAVSWVMWLFAGLLILAKVLQALNV